MQKSASVRPRTGISKFTRNEPIQVREEVRLTVGTTIVEPGTNNACIRSDKGEPDEPIPKGVNFGFFYDGHCQPNVHSPACALANRDNCQFEEYAFSVLKKRKFQLEAAMSKSQALQAAA